MSHWRATSMGAPCTQCCTLPLSCRTSVGIPKAQTVRTVWGYPLFVIQGGHPARSAALRPCHAAHLW
eukprot:1160114-Pelagomonas_calceolata.AAC.15